jgi:DNA repair exonuclease SbcCD nuclease subunit
VKFLHSADWQIGARFRQFGDQAARLSEARLRTLRKALQEAETRGAEAFLIAGDLFEDNQVAPAVVTSVFDLFTEFDKCPILILPGNHDPFTGPASIWGRRPFAGAPAHIKVFTSPEARPLGEGWIVANPLLQKRSTFDPSRKLVELAAALPAEASKIGMTHGSPMIESQHQADDHPIALEAATRAGLDYLALGHWHDELRLDGGRMVMSGSPEPTDFSERGTGAVLEVEIERHVALPKITPLQLAEWRWAHHVFDLADTARAMAEVEAAGAEFARDEARSVVWRATLCGNVWPGAVEEFRRRLSEIASERLLLDVRDETISELTDAEIAGLCREHPLIAQVMEDLASLSARASGELGTGEEGAGISPTEFEALCARIGRAPHEMTPDFIAKARRLLTTELREASETC